jgi:Fic family protein
MYIHELDDWPSFDWASEPISGLLAKVRHRQGRLVGRMEGLGFRMREEAVLATLTQDVLKSSEIEGEMLEREQVRSSVARRLGMDVGGLARVDRDVEGVVEMMLDATQRFDKPLNEERLFGWHACLFPTGHSGMRRITTGGWRDDRRGPMQVVSGPVGKERVHFVAPEAGRLPIEMTAFLEWLQGDSGMDPVVKAAVAHLWFVTVHPFDDGNGRIARAIADMCLARSESSPRRFYSMSAQIGLERNEYYRILEQTQKGTLDVTGWVEWFLGCLDRAFDGAETTLSAVLRKARFWEVHGEESWNERQRKIVNRLLDGFDGKLTSSKWASLGKCSQDTAGRDIADLVERGILVKEGAGGRSTSYALAKPAGSWT